MSLNNLINYNKIECLHRKSKNLDPNNSYSSITSKEACNCSNRNPCISIVWTGSATTLTTSTNVQYQHIGSFKVGQVQIPFHLWCSLFHRLWLHLPGLPTHHGRALIHKHKSYNSSIIITFHFFSLEKLYYLTIGRILSTESSMKWDYTSFNI